MLNLCCCLHDEPLNNEEHAERFDKDFFDPWEAWKKGLKKIDDDLENVPSENLEVEMYQVGYQVYSTITPRNEGAESER